MTTQPLRPLTWAAVLCLALATTGCSKRSAKAPAAAAPEPAPVAQAAPPQPTFDPHEEPSEEVLRKLEFETYAAIEQQGGMPVQVTATGQNLVLKPKLYEVRKDSCKPVPQAPAGHFECYLTIKLSLAPDGRDPSEQGERIFVKRGPKGEWVQG